MKNIGKTLLIAIGVIAVLMLVAEADAELAIPVLLIAVGLGLVLFGFKGQKKASHAQIMPLLSKEREAHYLKSGMSQSEIEFFRDTMNGTKQQIEVLQTNINKSAKLKAIDLRHDTLRASKALFKELVKDPQKLHNANHFLYTHLPNMVDLTNKFIEVNGHEIKNKETYEKIEESAQIIDQMAALIAHDYSNFVAEDLDELDVELSIAKQSLKRDNS